MSHYQIVTISFFKFQGVKNKFWALKMMQLAHPKLSKVKGLTFYKLMGSGGGNGFEWYPNFGVFSLLCCWDNEATGKAFFETHDIYKAYKNRAQEIKSYYLTPIKTQGNWSGKNPFLTSESFQKDNESKLAILTRATIKLGELIHFWKYVPEISAKVKQSKGCEISIGIGEWPIFQQATFSIWENEQALKEFAYIDKKHAKAVRLTKERNWYSEEQFTRFKVLKEEGSWN